MFGKPIRLFKVFDFQVSIDVSWFLLFFLITWSLAQGLFPAQFPMLAAATYWGMGITGALGLFLSILVHELAHSLVARRFGLAMKGITLFLFGGMAEMPEEPARPAIEFWMAIAGPLTSIALSALFYGVSVLGLRLDWPTFWYGIFAYLGVLNIFLAAFNLVPAFPLDGGRVLRSIIWGMTHDFGRATRIAAAVGTGFGIALFMLGAVRIVSGNVVGGVWWILIGLFIRAAASSSLQQMNVSRLLARERVGNVMNSHPVTVGPSLPVRSLVEDFFYKHKEPMFPVLDNGHLAGCVSLDQVKSLEGDWETRQVRDIMRPCALEASVPVDMEVDKALRHMRETGQTRLLVTQDGELLGVLNSHDLLEYLSMKMKLEKPERRRPAERRGPGQAGSPLPA